MPSAQHSVAEVKNPPDLPLPPGVRVPFGWRAFAVPDAKQAAVGAAAGGAAAAKTAKPGKAEEPKPAFKNWCRGVAWYLLGMTRTLAVLKSARGGMADELRDELRRASAWAVGLQGGDGLWRNFLDEHGSAADTSGSAGIAAALALGVAEKLLPDANREPAERCLSALRGRLTPDGLLSGVAPSNKGGEELQRSDYRVLMQMGMGLMAQLQGALGRKG
jgi:rhamnogalacturonyl hydrolase YesR